MPNHTRKFKTLSKKLKKIEQLVNEDNYSKDEPTEDELTKVLNKRQIRFCQEYIKDLQPYRAYRAAGYTGVGYSGQCSASALFNNGKVQKYIDWLQRRKRRRNEATADNVIKELVHIAFCNIGDIAQWTASSVIFKSSEALTPAQIATIKLIRTKTHPNGTTEMYIQQHDKLTALRMLCEHLQLFGDKAPTDEEVEDAAAEIKKAADKLFNSVPISAGAS